MKIIIARKM